MEGLAFTAQQVHAVSVGPQDMTVCSQWSSQLCIQSGVCNFSSTVIFLEVCNTVSSRWDKKTAICYDVKFVRNNLKIHVNALQWQLLTPRMRCG